MVTTPIVEWGFNEGSGDVVNLRGPSYGFALTGNSLRVGGALSQGVSEVQSGPALDAGLQTAARTWMVDAKAPGNDPSWFLELHRAGVDDTGVWGFLNLTGSFRFRAKNSVNTPFERVLTADTSNFHNLCATHDGTVLRVYRDGLQVGADISMPFAVWGADDFRVLDGAGSSCFIDNVRIWNVALTAAEVMDWKNTAVGSNPSTGGSMPNSVADTQMAKLPGKVGFSGSLQDMLAAWWKSQSGGMPAGLSVSDYERGAYIFATGASPSLSISDLERLFYTAAAVPQTQDGVTLSLIDRRKLYWENLV